MDGNLKWTEDELIALMSMAIKEEKLPKEPFSPGDTRLQQLSEADKSAFLAQHLCLEQGKDAQRALQSTLNVHYPLSSCVT